MHPNQFILAETLEWIKLPYDLTAILTTKSSEAREGLQIETANLIHPRFSGTVTLELKNNGEVPIKLYPGLTIGQISLLKLNIPIDGNTPIAKSTFPYAVRPVVATKFKKDLDTLKKFKNFY